MKGGILAKGLILIAGIYVFLKFVLPLVTAPLPASLIFLYLALTVAGIMIFGTLSAGSMEAFLGPIFRFLSGEGAVGATKLAWIGIMVAFPTFIAWQTY